ncbi:hypothetical protein BJ322DRAFT_1022033 [Thelephora terrestris]|uniref:Uncharacterized protein n=1 Tax=Thelephora terrestris TaxID=56493 RepID=A0A9P6HCR5_9AGAM|nr:hypothetical protein BJ322DRAFT_1022033 [Thelephora terrestris]
MALYSRGFMQLCEKTKWEVACYTALAALLAQLTVASRLYAVSGRNKLHASVLFVLLAAQSCAGIWLTVVAGTHPIQSLPQINLDAFKVCLVQQWRPGVISFVTIGVAFVAGTVTDAFALVSIFVTTGWRNFRRYPGIPSLVTTILRDATMYFFAMFACQLLLLFFLFLAPVQIQLLPGVTHTIFLPMMACRLMLSLKKAASEPRGMWTLTNEGTENGRGIFTDRSIRFGDAPGEISDTTTSPSGGDVELWAVTRSPRSMVTGLLPNLGGTPGWCIDGVSINRDTSTLRGVRYRYLFRVAILWRRLLTGLTLVGGSTVKLHEIVLLACPRPRVES